jgi:hypothetical protein
LSLLLLLVGNAKSTGVGCFEGRTKVLDKKIFKTLLRYVSLSISSGTEPDLGTRYPTRIQDSNGNFISIEYAAGKNSPWAKNSSSRIAAIFDVRDRGFGLGTHRFSYVNDHLDRIEFDSGLGKNESYRLAYAAEDLASPFTGGGSFGPTMLLTSLTREGLNDIHGFEYNNDSGELTKVNLPRGGYLRWAYRNFTYSGTRVLREVQYRYLKPAAEGSAELTYTIQRLADSGLTVHSQAALLDPSNTAKRVWEFETSTLAADAWKIGLVTQERSVKVQGSTNTILRAVDYTWVRDGDSRPYIGTVQTTLDGQATSKKEQTLDTYGNVTDLWAYDYGASEPSRKYRWSYFPGYASLFIHNRVSQMWINDVRQVSNFYDWDYWCNPGGPLEDRGELRQHDYSNYGASFKSRGNVIYSESGGVVSCYGYDTTGMLAWSRGRAPHTTVNPGMNNTVPEQITTGSLAVEMNWNSFLGLEQTTGSNQATATTTYDVYGRVKTTTSVHGAVTESVYASGTARPYTE